MGSACASLWNSYLRTTAYPTKVCGLRTVKAVLAVEFSGPAEVRRQDAQILVRFMADALWKTLEKWQEKAGLGTSPRTLLTELGAIHGADVVLPLADGARRHLRIRCVVRPDNTQASLLDRLGLRLPERLRLAAVMPGMQCRPDGRSP